MLRFDIVTIFPDFFREAFDYGIIRRARTAELVEIRAHDLRAWTTDKHHSVDDRPFGGGDGMVFKPEPVFAAFGELTGKNERVSIRRKRESYVVAQGQVLRNKWRRILREALPRCFDCGRYEGVDERVVEGWLR